MPADSTAQLPLAPEVCSDLSLAPGDVLATGSSDAPGSRLLQVPVSSGNLVLPAVSDLGKELSESGVLLMRGDGAVSEGQLAQWRNAMWPLLHVVAIYEEGDFGLRRRTLQGRKPLQDGGRSPSTILALQRTAHVLSPAATVAKFDGNAAGWDGDPKGPGYPHFRWMRRYVGKYASASRRARILDFGCGAGWVGIEAARGVEDVELCFFDPSPEMVRIAGGNAAANGITKAIGRTGFGESPPFPAQGEAPFELVISSGVVSFSPDVETWLDGLERTLAPGATLVVGDIHRNAAGFRRRRTRRAILPVRELAAHNPDEIRAGLEQRGLRHLETSYYQLTWPIPQLMHLNETRLKGLLTWPLLLMNRLMAGTSRHLHLPPGSWFDSWVMRFVKPS
ncbi:MAG: SAM-dependent methyltransferase [Planctomycetota bacterium]|jgi:SAM-dependent methyltransferase